MTFLENNNLAMLYKQNRLNANWQSMTHSEDTTKETTESLISCSNSERPNTEIRGWETGQVCEMKQQINCQGWRTLCTSTAL